VCGVDVVCVGRVLCVMGHSVAYLSVCCVRIVL
jgi:hypothetical protein